MPEVSEEPNSDDGPTPDLQKPVTLLSKESGIEDMVSTNVQTIEATTVSKTPQTTVEVEVSAGTSDRDMEVEEPPACISDPEVIILSTEPSFVDESTSVASDSDMEDESMTASSPLSPVTVTTKEALAFSTAKNRMKRRSEIVRPAPYTTTLERSKTANPAIKKLSDNSTTLLTYQFPNSEIIPSKKTAVILLNPSYMLTNASITPDQRCITATVYDKLQKVELFQIINIYAPPQEKDKPDFYNNLLCLLDSASFDRENMIITGDFNLHLNERHLPPSLKPWTDWLRKHFHNVFTDSPWENANTYDNGHQSSVIDYCFISRSRHRFAVNANNHVLPSSWSDHRLLSFEMELPEKSATGPGTWRMNPLLLESDHFIATMHIMLDQLHDYFDLHETINTQDQWDTIKDSIHILAIQEGFCVSDRPQRGTSKENAAMRTSTRYSAKGQTRKRYPVCDIQ
ncbi:hypothetical protein BC943DRAFT_336382 [Umbelopsis sp. AD052]|nr:hypothetical protein BC943DRAFT_336382 [Umbelopsis sp. AD052]